MRFDLFLRGAIDFLVFILYVNNLPFICDRLIIFIHSVGALLTDTLVSGQLYLRPPCLKPHFNSHTNSAFLHSHDSHKRTFP